MNKNFSYYVQDYFKEYLTVIRKLSTATISSYSWHFQDFIKFLKSCKIDVDVMPIEDFSYDLIMNFIKYLQEKNNCPKSINTKIVSLKTFTKYLMNRNLNVYDECNKIVHIQALKCEANFPEYYSIEEIQFLLNSIDIKKRGGLKQLAILTVLYEGALRVSELCNLKIDEVDVSKSNASILISKSKNGHPRKIMLGADASSILKKYIKIYKPSSESFLFQNSHGEKYSRSGIYKLLERCVNNAKNICPETTYFSIKPHPHILRHSKATHMLDAGIDLITIRDFLGHLWLSSTEIYAHVSKKKQEEIIKKNSLNKNIKIHRTSKEKHSLESWLHDNFRN